MNAPAVLTAAIFIRAPGVRLNERETEISVRNTCS